MCVPRSRAKLISRFIGLNYDNKDTYLQFTYVCMLCIYYGVCTATDTDTHTDNTLNKKPTVGMEFLQWICLTYTKINLLQQRFLASINLCANTIFICYMKISFSIACSISCRDFVRAFYNIPCMYIKTPFFLTASILNCTCKIFSRYCFLLRFYLALIVVSLDPLPSYRYALNFSAFFKY